MRIDDKDAEKAVRPFGHMVVKRQSLAFGCGLATLVATSLVRCAAHADDPRGAGRATDHRQPPTSPSSPTAPPEPRPVSDALPRKAQDEAQRQFARYLDEFRGRGSDARILLDTIYALGLRKTEANLRAVQTALHASVTDDERIALTRILAGFHTRDDALRANAGIRSELRDLAYSGTAGVAHTATLAYARLGYFDDSLDLLRQAKQDGHLGTDEYYGELTYLMRVAPGNAQLRIVRELSFANNAFSVEVLASTIRDRGDLKPFSPEAAAVVRHLVMAGEPAFPAQADDFGLVDAVRYSTWLKAAAVLNAPGDADYLVAKLEDGGVDPRKLIAFLIDADPDQLACLAANRSFADAVGERIASYAARHEDNRLIQDAATEALARLATARRQAP